MSAKFTNSRNTGLIRKALSFLFALSVLSGFLQGAFAEADGAAAEGEAVLQTDEIQAMFDAYIAENGLSAELISVGYVYTATGEEWYHLPDEWYYSASLYKVPLMMLYAEKEAAGELTQDSEFFGMKLSEIEDEILIYSNNPLAYSMLLNIADAFECRRLMEKFADLPEDYFSWEYIGYSDFSARYMTEVFSTLYREPERFPGIVERLKQAQPGHYFRMSLDAYGVPVAQKYGNYTDEDGYDWNHTAGIVFTPHPFLLTVMTKYGGISENIISDLAELFYSYTLKADRILEERLSAQEAAGAEDQASLDASVPPAGDEAETGPDEPSETEPALPEAPVQPEEGNTPALPAAEASSGRENASGHLTVMLLFAAAAAVSAVLALLLRMRRGRRRRASKTGKKE